MFNRSVKVKLRPMQDLGIGGPSLRWIVSIHSGLLGCSTRALPLPRDLETS